MDVAVVLEVVVAVFGVEDGVLVLLQPATADRLKSEHCCTEQNRPEV